MYLHARIRGEYIQVNFTICAPPGTVAMTDFIFFNHCPEAWCSDQKDLPARGGPFTQGRITKGSRLNVTYNKETFPSVEEE